jgi:hypothetical protein
LRRHSSEGMQLPHVEHQSTPYCVAHRTLPFKSLGLAAIWPVRLVMVTSDDHSTGPTNRTLTGDWPGPVECGVQHGTVGWGLVRRGTFPVGHVEYFVDKAFTTATEPKLSIARQCHTIKTNPLRKPTATA